MTKNATPEEFLELFQLCEKPEFTPGKKSFPEMMRAFQNSDEDLQKSVTRALLRAGLPAANYLIREISKVEPPVRARVVRALMRFAADDLGEARTTIRNLLQNEDEHTRRVAIQAVGQWRDLSDDEERDLENTLLAMWNNESLPTQRGIVRSLGRLGGDSSVRFLEGISAQKDDPELTRLTTKALLELERRLTRHEVSSIDPRAKIVEPLRVLAFCKPGLEGFVEKELARYVPQKGRGGQVKFLFSGPLEDIFVSRVMIDFGFEIPAVRIGKKRPGEVLAEVLASKGIQAILRTLTKGKIRYRIEWSGGGKLRSETDLCVQLLSERMPEMINDPSQRVWDVDALVEKDRVEVLLRPRVEDTRFAWRVSDVPAASHPTVAAALVQLAGLGPKESVWDPFVGSGLELIERGLAGPAARLVGTDIDMDALTAARSNAESAGVDVELVQAKAQSFRVGQVDCILSNPPLGWRVSDEKGLRKLFDAFLPHAAKSLKPGGRLVWMTRHPKVTDAQAKKAGLKVVYSHPVDLGGMTAFMQRLEQAP